MTVSKLPAKVPSRPERIQPADPGLKLNVPMLLRVNIFHLLQAVAIQSIGLDKAYRRVVGPGKRVRVIFWDELFIFPSFNFGVPEIARPLLTYR